MAYSRPMWSGQNPLRKQKSYSDSFSSTNKTNSITQNTTVGRPRLQKQISVDQPTIRHNSNFHNSNNSNVISDGKPEASLRIFTAVKKRMQVCNENNNECV